jgi:hypothetical protein
MEIKKISSKLDRVSDLDYSEQGLFTSFFPNTLEGENVWRSIPQGKILTVQLPSVLAQLRKAGYSVVKAKKITKKQEKEIYTEMESMGLL